MLVAAVALATYVIVITYRIFFAPGELGVLLLWDRDILAFFLVGLIVFGMGIIGEYVGRIYQQVRERPRYMIRAVLERPAGDPAPGAGHDAPVAAVDPLRRP